MVYFHESFFFKMIYENFFKNYVYRFLRDFNLSIGTRNTQVSAICRWNSKFHRHWKKCKNWKQFKLRVKSITTSERKKERIEEFHSVISEGPLSICSCCDQLRYKHTVSSATNVTLKYSDNKKISSRQAIKCRWYWKAHFTRLKELPFICSL